MAELSPFQMEKEIFAEMDQDLDPAYGRFAIVSDSQIEELKATEPKATKSNTKSHLKTWNAWILSLPVQQRPDIDV